MKTLYFDWGGVITTDPGDDFLAQLLLKAGAQPTQIEQALRRYIGPFMVGQLTEEQFWAQLRQQYQLSLDSDMTNQFDSWSGLNPDSGMVDLVDQAKAKGWQVGLLTNVIPPTYRALKSAGHYDQFHAVIASCREGLAKPDPRIYHLALQKLNTHPTESIFIDDKQSNLDPAQKIGFTTILARNADQVIQDLVPLL